MSTRPTDHRHIRVLGVGVTKIQWTNKTWNPVRGCSRVSKGCENCYAERDARYRHGGAGGAYEGLTRIVNGRPVWNGKIRLVPEKLDEPLRWRKPHRIFVNSMSDLFHENVPDEFIDRVFAVMALCPLHTFQILTKRPERMREYVESCARQLGRQPQIRGEIERFGLGEDEIRRAKLRVSGAGADWSPLPNVHLGVSVEDQTTADERIPLLLDTPAAVRWVSYEPALDAIDFSRWMWPLCWSWDGKYRSPSEALAAGVYAEKKRQALVSANAVFINWLVVGGESGPGARPCDVAWIRSTVQQCKAAGVPLFVKQLGAKPRGWCIYLKSRKGGDLDEWPEDLRVREYPA